MALLARFDFDFIVIGSGFGGSVAAMRLSEKGYKVCVLERGKRFRAEDFAKTNWNLRKYLWMPLIKCFGIQNLSLFKNVLILSGVGVGGGSLVYANTLLEPGDSFYQSPVWSGLADWKRELEPHYKTARKMLGVTKNPLQTEIDQHLFEISKEMGRDSTFKTVDVGIYFSEKGKEGQKVPDPYFGGKGPERAGCVYCGGCMVGCRHNAKNTLDKNYLYFAEKNGAEVRAESNVVDIRALDTGDIGDIGDIGDTGHAGGGYEVCVESATAWFFKKPYTLRARGVVLSAGVLGSVNLLMRCRDVTRSLKSISPKLGDEVRTNSEALIGVTTRRKDLDVSRGIAITTGFYADEKTHIEPVRYPRGSSFMRLLATPMVDDGTAITRPLKLVATILLKPIQTLKLLFNTRWAESTIILLVMQTLDNRMKLKLGRNLFTLFRNKLTTEQDRAMRIPSFIAVGHAVARRLAEKTEGIPQSAINEVALQIPTTAHILGGCCIGTDRETGVIDKKHEVFGYKNLFVCDGSVIPANLGVNPSLTITAMTERAMAFVPPRAGGVAGASDRFK